MSTVLAPVAKSVAISCAAEVFLALAKLQQEHPEQPDFTIQEIVGRVALENVYGYLRPGIIVHVSQHCVANKPPNPAKHRMLFATGKHTRRLVLPTDVSHPDRTGKIFPGPDELPERFRPVLAWAKGRFEKALQSPGFWAEGAEERIRHLGRSDSLLSVGYVPEDEPAAAKQWLGGLLKLRLAGAHLADGTDPDEHIRQLREGWD